jgi:hypothetical protein
MEPLVDLPSLKGITILYKNDLYELGTFVVKAFDARWAGSGSKARPTLHGLARIYGSILNCDPEPFELAIEAHGLSLGSAVERSAERSRRSRPGAGRVRGNRRPA